MSWLAVTFTTQEINSLRLRPADMFLLLILNEVRIGWAKSGVNVVVMGTGERAYASECERQAIINGGAANDKKLKMNPAAPPT